MTRKLLVTGATGRIGPHVIDALVGAGFHLRVATPEPVKQTHAVNWTQVDFTQQVDYDALVSDVDIVIHLAAELRDRSRMEPVNVRATSFLAAAAEKAGVGLFIYTSTVAVYGFRRDAVIDEASPMLPTEPSLLRRVPYLAEEYLETYSVTKLKGELALKQHLHHTRALTLRLTNVVREDDIAAVLHWSIAKRIWRGYRRTHQLYVKDVAAAIEFFVRRYLDDGMEGLSQCETYIVSQDDEVANGYGSLFRRYELANGARIRWSWISLPAWMDRLKDCIKFRRLRIGFPAGAVSYSSRKLANAGFKYRYGIIRVQDDVIAKQVARNRNSTGK